MVTDKPNNGTELILIDKKTLQVNYVNCYNKVYLNPEIKQNSSITITVKGLDDKYGYIGVVNEKFDKLTCLCLCPPNAFYLHSDGRAIIDGKTTYSSIKFLPSKKVTISMKVDVKMKTITFNNEETYNITGNSWKFIVGKCLGGIFTYQIQ